MAAKFFLVLFLGANGIQANGATTTTISTYPNSAPSTSVAPPILATPLQQAIVNLYSTNAHFRSILKRMNSIDSKINYTYFLNNPILGQIILDLAKNNTSFFKNLDSDVQQINVIKILISNPTQGLSLLRLLLSADINGTGFFSSTLDITKSVLKGTLSVASTGFSAIGSVLNGAGSLLGNSSASDSVLLPTTTNGATAVPVIPIDTASLNALLNSTAAQLETVDLSLTEDPKIINKYGLLANVAANLTTNLRLLYTQCSEFQTLLNSNNLEDYKFLLANPNIALFLIKVAQANKTSFLLALAKTPQRINIIKSLVANTNSGIFMINLLKNQSLSTPGIFNSLANLGGSTLKTTGSVASWLGRGVFSGIKQAVS